MPAFACVVIRLLQPTSIVFSLCVPCSLCLHVSSLHTLVVLCTFIRCGALANTISIWMSGNWKEYLKIECFPYSLSRSVWVVWYGGNDSSMWLTYLYLLQFRVGKCSVYFTTEIKLKGNRLTLGIGIGINSISVLSVSGYKTIVRMMLGRVCSRVLSEPWCDNFIKSLDLSKASNLIILSIYIECLLQSNRVCVK